MASPGFTAQMAHVFFACAVILAARLYRYAQGETVYLGVLAAAVKEFWYDLCFELPVQTLGDSALDFSMYCVGMLLGLLLTWWADARAG